MTNSKLKLLAYIVLVEMYGLGVLFAMILGMATSQGGTLTLDMTQYGEMWIEYILILVLTALSPWAFWYVTTVEKPTTG